MIRAGVAVLVLAVALSAAVGAASANHIVMHGGPFGGVVVSLVAHPLEPEILYLGAFGSGVYTSADGGRRWTATSRGLDDLTVLALAIDPVSPRVMYAATDSGVFISRDGGGAWDRLGSRIAARNVRSLAVVPRRPTVLFAATDQGVLWSYDQGVTWASRGSGISSRDLRILRVDPGNSARLFAAGFGGVFRTDTGGRHWRVVNRGLTDLRVRALAIDPNRPGTVYAGTAGGGVFVTADGGGRWRPLNEGLRNPTVLSLLVASRGQIFAGTVGGVYRRETPAAAWELAGEDVLSLTVTFVVEHPHRPGTIYAGTGGLVFVSDDDGRRWRELALSVAGASPPAPRAMRTGGIHSHERKEVTAR